MFYIQLYLKLFSNFKFICVPAENKQDKLGTSVTLPV